MEHLLKTIGFEANSNGEGKNNKDNQSNRTIAIWITEGQRRLKRNVR